MSFSSLAKIFLEVKPISFPNIKSVKADCTLRRLNGKGINRMQKKAKKEVTVFKKLPLIIFVYCNLG